MVGKDHVMVEEPAQVGIECILPIMIFNVVVMSSSSYLMLIVSNNTSARLPRHGELLKPMQPLNCATRGRHA